MKKMNKEHFVKLYNDAYKEGRYFERRRIGKMIKLELKNLLVLEKITNYDAYGCSRGFKTLHIKVADLKLFINDLVKIVSHSETLLKQPSTEGDIIHAKFNKKYP